MTDPVSRTILLLDIERFSDRDDVEQAYLRRMLYDITDRTLERAGIDETRRLRADRGDSVMELIDANAPVTALLRALLVDVPAQLRAVNRMASSSAQIRLRGVLATGYVAVDKHDGWVGTDLNNACRLLDAQLLRAALSERPHDFALMVSDALYTGVVRHDHPGIPADEFHPVGVDTKNGPMRAWLHGPLPSGHEAAPTGTIGSTSASTAGTADQDHRGTGAGEAPGGSGDRPAPQAPPTPEATDAPRVPAQGTSPESRPAPGPVFNFNGAVNIGGSVVAGDQTGVSGGQVTGDVNMGGRNGSDGS
ncbi:hypothetical protein [Streptomyces sp. B21-083]|uniref:hypothetical protein n=1 Tax=Streptomyces sp. B21-083 TaxID=3039410 RepID=UPI002FF38FCF